MNEIIQWVAIVCLTASVAYLIAAERLHYKILKAEYKRTNPPPEAANAPSET